MDEYLSEKEQWEALVAGAKEQIPTVLGTVLVIAIAFGGWNLWRDHREHALAEASTAYENLLANADKQDPAKTIKTAEQMLAGKLDGPYADQTRLIVARLQIDTGHPELALPQLQAVMDSSGDDSLRLLARLRLARVQLSLGKPDAALTLLRGVDAGAFAARFAMVRGDADAALGKAGDALKEYQLAKNDPQGTVDAATLDLKIRSLSGS